MFDGLLNTPLILTHNYHNGNARKLLQVILIQDLNIVWQHSVKPMNSLTQVPMLRRVFI